MRTCWFCNHKILKIEKVYISQLPDGIALKFSNITEHPIGTGLVKEYLHSKVMLHVQSQSLPSWPAVLQFALPWWKPSTLSIFIIVIIIIH